MHIHSIHTGLLQDALTLDQYTSVTSWGPLSLLSHELPHRSNPHRIGRCWPPLVGICERPHHPLHCLPRAGMSDSDEEEIVDTIEFLREWVEQVSQEPLPQHPRE